MRSLIRVPSLMAPSRLAWTRLTRSGYVASLMRVTGNFVFSYTIFDIEHLAKQVCPYYFNRDGLNHTAKALSGCMVDEWLTCHDRRLVTLHKPFLQFVMPKNVSNPQRAAYRNKQSGFSLIEVLISIIILSFGLLGMVGLQAAALQSNKEARLQSTAMTQATELAEMMRGNKDVGIITTTANPYMGDFSYPLTPNTSSYCLNVAISTTPCAGTTTIADAQMTEWLSRVDAELPGAKVKICVDAAPYDASGLPQWDCTNPVSGATAPAVIKIGWTRGSTNRAAIGAAAFDRATRPAIVLPITAGSAS